MKPFLRLPLSVFAIAVATGCSTLPQPPLQAVERKTPFADPVRVLDRLTWGANPSSVRDVMQQGLDAYMRAQLNPSTEPDIPEAVREHIAMMSISQTPAESRVIEMNRQRLSADAVKDDEQRSTSRQAYQQALAKYGRETSTRALLRAVYSKNQLREQMTWFWFDHFNVYQNRGLLRALVADYEDRAIRPYALGHFRDMLRAVVHHPAMLIYLDNAQNASGRINENLARELMELHTLGVDGGYTQVDVQELARILTGVGVNLRSDTPQVRRAVRDDYVRDGLFEFNPNRHDYGDKKFLGGVVKGGGLKEVDEAIDRLARHPSTARFISRKIATYLVSDTPPGALVDRMAAEFTRTDGDIAATLAVLFDSPDFAASLGRKFKDPVHYVVSAVRFAYDTSDTSDATDPSVQKIIVNAQPMINWLNRMGQPLYGRQTPDGYPQAGNSWTSPAQMATRFEIARAIVTGGGGGRMFRPEGATTTERPPPPQLSNVVYRESLQARLSTATRAVLDEANSRDDWNVLLLASPEFQNR